jgi:hypothetical protein
MSHPINLLQCFSAYQQQLFVLLYGVVAGGIFYKMQSLNIHSLVFTPLAIASIRQSFPTQKPW